MHMPLFLLFLLPPSLYFPYVNKNLLLNCKKKKKKNKKTQIGFCYELNYTLPNSCLSPNPQYLKMWLHLKVGHIRRWLSQSAASIQFSSVTQSCPTLCDPMNHSTPGLPVHHHLPEFTQTHVHWVGDAIQPSHPLLSPFPHDPNPSQNQSLFQYSGL